MIEVNNNAYEIKNPLTFGHIKRINRLFGQSIAQENIDVTTLSTEEIIKLRPKIESQLKFTDDQLELSADIIKHSLGLSDQELENIPFKDVEELFKKILEESQPKKKSEQHYG